MQTLSLPSRPLALGILLIIVTGSTAWWLAGYVPTLGNVTLAILLGVLVGNLLPETPTVELGAKFAEKQLLPLAIALVGVELMLDSLIALGPLAAVVILVSMSTALLVSVKLGEWLGFSRSFSLLIGAGNGICGSSAVASTSLAIGADESDTGISIGVINLLGTVGIFVLPPLVGALALTHLQSGLLIGGTLQAVGQAVAAGFAVGPETGQIATVVKMGRVLMLGPVVVMIGYWMQSQNKALTGARPRVQVPRFIIGFFIMSVIASLHLLPPAVIAVVATVGKYLLVLAMAGIGMRIRLRTLFRSGLPALLFGLGVSVIQIATTLIVVLLIVRG